MSYSDLHKMDEEFNNFMVKVNDVYNIIKKMSSTDKNLQVIGDLEAQRYLGDSNKQIHENVELKIKNDRTIINKQLPKDDATKSQEAFMREVEMDANRRFEDKKRRKEHVETLKKRANLAFRRQEYEKALSLYNQCLDLVKDIAYLYVNRALCYMNLNFYTYAIKDLENSLKLHENSLKAWLLLGKSYYLNGDTKEFENAIQEARNRSENNDKFITEFVVNFIKNHENQIKQQKQEVYQQEKDTM